MPDVGRSHFAAALPSRVAAQREARARVGLVAGCVQRVFFPGVNEATLRVLSAEGCEVRVPAGQGCCGALSRHAGREREARDLVGRLIARFEAEGVERVVVNAAGCGSHLKTCAALFADGPPAEAARAEAFAARVRDVSEFLAGLPPMATRQPLPARVVYQDACHLAHAQGIRAEPRTILRAVPGVELLEISDADACCGSAGTYSLTEPDASDEIGARKVDAILAAGAQIVATANVGCAMQIRKLLRARGVDLPAVHPIEIVDASIRGAALASAQPAPGGTGMAPLKT